MKILYLPIETINRELEGKLILAHDALSRNYCVVVGAKGQVKSCAEEIGAGSYIYKSFEKNAFPNIGDKSKTKVLFCALDEEGLVYPSEKVYLLRIPDYGIDYLDVIFLWGQKQKDIITNNVEAPSSKLFVTGNPRIDCLKNYLEGKAQDNQLTDQYDDYVLVNTNFQAGNISLHYNQSYLEKQKKVLEIRGLELTEERKSFYIGKEQYSKRLFDSYVDMLVKVSKDYNEINFIVRPHPSENWNSWKERLKDCKNVHVVHEGNVYNWISQAKAVIHTGCTTGIEAFAMKKVVLRYNPLEESSFEPPLPNKFGYNCKSLEILSENLQKVLSGQLNHTYKEQLHLAKPFIHNIDSESSTKLMLDAIDSRYTENYCINETYDSIYAKVSHTNFKTKLTTRLKGVLKKYPKLLSFLVGKEKAKKILTKNPKFAGIEKAQIISFLETLNRINNKQYKFNIQEIKTDTFLIARRE